MYKLSLHITRSVVKFSVPGGKYRTDFRSVFSVCRYSVFFGIVNTIATSVSVSVFQNIGYRFGISVYRPKTSMLHMAAL